MGSHGIKDRVAIVGMGCTRFARALGQGHRRPAGRRGGRGRSRRPASRKDDVDAYWLGTAMSGMSGMTLARPLQLAGQAGHARRELLRDRVGGVAPGRVRGRERRVRRRDGDRRREGEGQRLPGPRSAPPIADRRHRPHAHRGGDVRDVAPAYAQEVRRRRRRDARGARAHRVEEPLQRRAQPARAVPPGDVDRDDLRRRR